MFRRIDRRMTLIGKFTNLITNKHHHSTPTTSSSHSQTDSNSTSVQSTTKESSSIPIATTTTTATPTTTTPTTMSYTPATTTTRTKASVIEAEEIVRRENEAKRVRASAKYEGLPEGIVLGIKMGDGAFSNVYQATLMNPDPSIPSVKVAVKCIRKYELSYTQVSHSFPLAHLIHHSLVSFWLSSAGIWDRFETDDLAYQLDSVFYLGKLRSRSALITKTSLGIGCTSGRRQHTRRHWLRQQWHD